MLEVDSVSQGLQSMPAQGPRDAWKGMGRLHLRAAPDALPEMIQGPNPGVRYPFGLILPTVQGPD